jgi:hypothetical protein
MEIPHSSTIGNSVKLFRFLCERIGDDTYFGREQWGKEAAAIQDEFHHI